MQHSKTRPKTMISFISILLIGSFLLDSNAIFASEPDETYRIGPEDILEIHVWKDSELSRKIVVRPDGKISFPLIGEIAAGGQSVAWLQKEIGSRIREYVKDTPVTVMVLQANANKFYVVGKVIKPGVTTIGRKINVMQALAIAGGLTPFANEDDILILRCEQGNQTTLHFNYNAVKKGSHIEQNIWLQDGDVIVVR